MNAKDQDKRFREVTREMDKLLLDTPLGGKIDFEKMKLEMNYGRLLKSQEAKLCRYVRRKRVYDLGAGGLGFSKLLLALGAEHVVAIDKELGYQSAEKVTKRPVTFREFITDGVALPQKEDVAFISWPDIHVVDGLLELAERCGTIIYLGKNVDGVSCGWPGFFTAMLERKVLAYRPAIRNSLIIYGERESGPPRRILGEERAGLDRSKLWTWGSLAKDDAEWR